MNCKKCGNEINENAKFCTKCGVAIDDADGASNKVAINNEAVTKKRNIVIASLSLFLVMLVSTVFFVVKASASEVLTYKSIKPIEQSQIKAMTSRSALELMIQQDADMFEFMNKPMHGNSDKLFEVFYNNLLNLCKIVKIEDLEDKEILKSVEDGAELNTEYISGRYSKYLNNSWAEYLNLSKRQVGYDLPQKLTDDVVAWQRFLSKYPTFVMKNHIKDVTKAITLNIIYNPEYQSDWLTLDEIKSAHEDFLKRVDPNTKEYELMKNAYEIANKGEYYDLQSSEFFKNLYDATGDKFFKQKFEQAKEWEAAQAKEARYENPLYSYEKMKNGYEFSDRIKQAVRKKDIVGFAEFVSFPITLRTLNNQEIDIQNKEQLIQLGANRIFTNNFIKEVCKDEDLFVSYRGFMMGNGPNLFFDYANDDTGIIKIYAINIE